MSLTRNVFKRPHYPIDIILQCVRWYLAYALSLRNLEEMMAECGIAVDHSTLYRWVIRLVPLLDNAFRRYKCSVGSRWRMDETYYQNQRAVEISLSRGGYCWLDNRFPTDRQTGRCSGTAFFPQVHSSSRRA